jgi:hypothetical protein
VKQQRVPEGHRNHHGAPKLCAHQRHAQIAHAAGTTIGPSTSAHGKPLRDALVFYFFLSLKQTGMRASACCLAARKFPEAELVEKVIRGSKGNGGTALNTSSSTVRLTHEPTGITIRVGDTRHLYANKSIARKRLFDKVEHATNPAESKITRGIEKQKKRNAKARYRAKLKYGASPAGADDNKHD